MSASGEHSSTKESVQVLLQEVWKFVSSLGEVRTDSSCGSPWLVQQQWRHFRDASTRFVEKSHEHDLGVAVVALAKSGKSTLFNALLGCSCLPTDDLSGSERICVIHHGFSGGPIPRLVEASGRLSGGEAAVHDRLQELNEERKGRENVWRMEPPVDITAPFFALAGRLLSPTMSLVDVPSPSEAKSDFQKHKVGKFLGSMDAVIYVLDYLKLKGEDEEEMLLDIQKTIPAIAGWVSQRVFFVVNKFDLASTGQGMNEAETREYVLLLLRDIGFKVKREQILLVSANNALLSRLIITEKADAAAMTKFGKLAFGMEFERVMGKREWKARAERMLETSGIVQLEEQVLSFLYTNGGAIKLLSLLDNEATLLQEIGSVAGSFKAALSRSLCDMRAGMDRLKSQLDNTLVDFDNANSELMSLEEDVVIKVQAGLHRLRKTVLNHIQCAFSVGPEVDTDMVLSPVWEGIHEDFVMLMEIQETDDIRAQDLLQELSDEVMTQIQSEIEIAWATVEDLGRERHMELIGQLNSHFERLSHLAEGILSKELGIHLDPVDITFKAPTLDEFQEKLHELLKMGINKQVKERNSLWRYFAGATYTVYTFEAGSIREYFETVVIQATDQSLQIVRQLVAEHVTRRVKLAEAHLRDYCDKYTQAVHTAIDVRNADIASNAGTMERVLQDISMIKKFRTSISDVQTMIDANLQTRGEVFQLKRLESRDSVGSAAGNDVHDEFVHSPVHGEGIVRVGSGKLRYVPPRSRFQAQDALLAGALGAERANSVGILDMTDPLWESPKAGRVHHQQEGRGSHWRNRSLGESGGSGQFSPRSDFFKNFNKAYRGGKSVASSRGGGGGGSGRGRGFHKKSESWN